MHPPAAMEKYTITRAGTDVECRMLFPPGFDRSRRYPLIVDVHGGPHGAFYDVFNPTQQVLATAGYLVLLVNPRGSATYGGDFAKAVMGDWGGEDFSGIMAAVDDAISRPYVDDQRLGIHGYSYGGYMTSWIVGHDRRFKAAVAGAPCINLDSMYGTSDIGVSFGELQWGGTRQEAVDRYRERSPLTYVANVETPVLLLHGEADARCPIEQSEQYFVALKRLGKRVEFVRFPDCSHLFLRLGHPRMREEYRRRILAWFDGLIGAQAG
jgi:dipeptidyl aminopeptidase/acylaminoacyl peptidase